ncbi:MAG: imidazoleglycerol-phosphate dehydratase HisB [Candidatus Margulisbacteria bacterium]|jgi:imidazoleglycerol-phosphate dehydratase|nr:imidazoleglycerol-phosphate dehydratase HisB [Candidatus Margulisiibacteriota bacterium]
MRTAKKERNTKETRITLELKLDGQGRAKLHTGLAFFDHMLELFAKHGNFDLTIAAAGDLQVDGHHTVEDVGLVLGDAFRQALQNKSGINRYGFFVLPMDEALAECAVDISGRPFLRFSADFQKARVGDFDAELIEEFWRAFVTQAGITAHIHLLSGANLHHQAEAIFKCMARALRMAAARDPLVKGIPSTKGVL